MIPWLAYSRAMPSFWITYAAYARQRHQPPRWWATEEVENECVRQGPRGVGTADEIQDKIQKLILIHSSGFEFNYTAYGMVYCEYKVENLQEFSNFLVWHSWHFHYYEAINWSDLRLSSAYH